MATNTAITGNSATAGTWSLSRVPNITDDVVIPSGVTVTMTGNMVCKSLTITDGTLTNTTGPWTITVGADASGVVNGNGTVTLNGVAGNALLRCTTSTGTLTIYAGLIAMVAATSRTCKVQVDISGTLTVYGNVTTSGAGGCYVWNIGATLALPTCQFNSTDFSATTTRVPLLTSAISTSLNFASKEPNITIYFAGTSAISFTVSANVHQYPGDLEFTSQDNTAGAQFARVGL